MIAIHKGVDPDNTIRSINKKKEDKDNITHY